MGLPGMGDATKMRLCGEGRKCSPTGSALPSPPHLLPGGCSRRPSPRQPTLAETWQDGPLLLFPAQERPKASVSLHQHDHTVAGLGPG